MFLKDADRKPYEPYVRYLHTGLEAKFYHHKCTTMPMVGRIQGQIRPLLLGVSM
jgi:hypothetical protein